MPWPFPLPTAPSKAQFAAWRSIISRTKPPLSPKSDAFWRGGRFVVFTATAEQERGYWLNHYFPEMMARSSQIMPSLAKLQADLEAAGFRYLTYDPWEVPPDPVDLMLYAGKHRPALYLDTDFRRGTSGFAKFCEPDELRDGVRRLEADIASGKIDEVIAGYAHDGGDYGFAVAECV